MVFSTGALVHAIACAPDAHKEGLNFPIIAVAAETVDGVCSAAIVGPLAVAPGRAVVDGALVVPVFVFGADKVYIIDGHFFTRCLAGVSDNGWNPFFVDAYDIVSGDTVNGPFVVFAGAAINVCNVLAYFFAAGTAVVGGGTIDAILRQPLVAELCCGIALQSEGLAGYGHRRTGIVVKGCR